MQCELLLISMQAPLHPCYSLVINHMHISLCMYNRFEEAYARVRQSFADIRRNVEQWRDAVLHSVSSLL